VALDPHSEPTDLSVPEDYKQHHPDEHPTDWGWHGEWGRSGRVAGYVVAAILLLMCTSTSYNFAGETWLIGIAIVLVLMLIWDANRRRNSWRK
jgi:hypothetical protein